MSDAKDARRAARQPAESYAYRDADGGGWARLTSVLGRVARTLTTRRRS